MEIECFLSLKFGVGRMWESAGKAEKLTVWAVGKGPGVGDEGRPEAWEMKVSRG
jgi:hypothetical protein